MRTIDAQNLTRIPRFTQVIGYARQVPSTERPVERGEGGSGRANGWYPHLVAEHFLVEDLFHGPREHHLREVLAPPPPQSVPWALLRRRRRRLVSLLDVAVEAIRGAAGIIVAPPLSGGVRAPHFALRAAASTRARRVAASLLVGDLGRFDKGQNSSRSVTGVRFWE
jgi:hypothetical protein